MGEALTSKKLDKNFGRSLTIKLIVSLFLVSLLLSAKPNSAILASDNQQTGGDRIIEVRSSYINKKESVLMTVPNLLHINFSNAVASDVLLSLHTEGLNGEKVRQIKELIQNVGGEQLSPIYELSAKEITQDRYGFAREFKLYLKPNINLNEAIEILQHSTMIENAKPIGIKKAF